MATRATVDIPLPGSALRDQLLNALDQPSLYEFTLLLPQLADELERDLRRVPDFHVARTVDALKSGVSNRWKMVMLTSLMHRRVLRSIIQGTVGFDIHQQGGSEGWYPQPVTGGEQGIYVVSLSRALTDGRFLNLREMRILVDGVEGYLAGARLLSKRAGLTQQERELVDWVRQVDRFDGVRRSQVSNKAVFMSSHPSAMDAYLDMLKRRRDQLERLDPTEVARPRQGPLYVGCSVNLKARIGQYTYLRDVNKPLGLTMTILKAKDIPMNMRHTIAMRVWEEDQLSFAEELINVLADSLVYQSGFNVAEPGANTSSGTSEWAAARSAVLGVTAHVRGNFKEMLEEADRQKRFRRMLKELDAAWRERKEQVTQLRLDDAEARLLFTMPFQERRKQAEATVAKLREEAMEQLAMALSAALACPEVEDDFRLV